VTRLGSGKVTRLGSGNVTVDPAGSVMLSRTRFTQSSSARSWSVSRSGTRPGSTRGSMVMSTSHRLWSVPGGPTRLTAAVTGSSAGNSPSRTATGSDVPLRKVTVPPRGPSGT
jgi:hypothetical protein